MSAIERSLRNALRDIAVEENASFFSSFSDIVFVKHDREMRIPHERVVSATEDGTLPELLNTVRTFFWLQNTGGLVVGVAGRRRSKFRRQAH